MLDALYQDRIDAVLNVPARPMPQPKPGFWDGVLSAVPRGFAIAANESARVVYRAATARADDTLRSQQQEADDFTAEAIFRRRLELDEERAGIDASLKAGADFYRPDPNTVGVAAQVLQGAATFITKAGVYTGVTGNPLAGAALTGADVGGTEFLNLRDQGVDADTATRVGAVRGVAAGVAAALPVAGSTLLRTAGLAATGGPATFIGEQAAAKAILDAADYSKLADQIDPFDPVGLAAATLGATVFGVGAYALRRGRATPSQNELDAALIQSGEDARPRLADPTDFRATAADEAALKRAEQQIAEGGRVDVADVAEPAVIAAAEREANFRAWFGDSKVVDDEGKPLVVYHGTGADIEQFRVSERGEFGGGIYLTPDTSGASDYATYRGQGPANVLPVFVRIENPATGAEAAKIASWQGEENARAILIERGHDGVIDKRSGQIVAFFPEQIKSAIGNSGRFDRASGSLTDPIASLARAVREEVAAKIEPVAEVPAERAADDPSARFADIKVARDDGTTVRGDEFLREVEEQARIETEEASLIQVAAECLLEVA